MTVLEDQAPAAWRSVDGCVLVSAPTLGFLDVGEVRADQPGQFAGHAALRMIRDAQTDLASVFVPSMSPPDHARTQEEYPRVQPANNLLAIHRASLARCGPSTSDPATAPSNNTTSARAVAFGSFTPAAVVHSRKRSANHSR